MKPENSLDNYEKWCTEWQQRFLTLDQDRLLHQIPGLDADGDYLTLSYYHSRYGIRRDTGEILCLEDPHPLTIFTRLNLYTLLWYCTEHAALTGEWMPFRNLKNASPFGPAFQKTVTDVFAKTFSGHLPELEQACRTLGGKKTPPLGCRIPDRCLRLHPGTVSVLGRGRGISGSGQHSVRPGRNRLYSCGKSGICRF